MIMDIDIAKISAKLWELLTVYGLQILSALVVLILGRWIARIVERIVKKMLARREVDPTILAFLGNLTYIAVLLFFIIAALNLLGIQTTSFIAVIGAAGLAIALALQKSLSNFAAGFLMIIFRPFKTGDYIEGGGAAGTVEKIQIFTTQLKTPDNKTVIIPNAKLTEDNITNYSTKGTRRVDMVFGIGYDDDIDKARDIINSILKSDNRILSDPPTVVAVSELADSSVNFIARPWVNAGDYWNVYWEVTERVKKQFDQEGISIPYPQQDVHIYEEKTASE
jgi:small conductance mechanosensitive channel